MVIVLLCRSRPAWLRCCGASFRRPRQLEGISGDARSRRRCRRSLSSKAMRRFSAVPVPLSSPPAINMRCERGWLAGVTPPGYGDAAPEEIGRAFAFSANGGRKRKSAFSWRSPKKKKITWRSAGEFRGTGCLNGVLPLDARYCEHVDPRLCWQAVPGDGTAIGFQRGGGLPCRAVPCRAVPRRAAPTTRPSAAARDLPAARGRRRHRRPVRFRLFAQEHPH
ncbi:Protein of unknown function [Gryllus bimaculatus]|nr:Protein of unknown function [Gryllus bimaculatus]